VARPWGQQRELEYQFANMVSSVDVEQASTNYLRYYTEHTEGLLKSGAVCSSEVGSLVFYLPHGLNSRDRGQGEGLVPHCTPGSVSLPISGFCG
jgi:hypothetical protein